MTHAIRHLLATAIHEIEALGIGSDALASVNVETDENHRRLYLQATMLRSVLHGARQIALHRECPVGTYAAIEAVTAKALGAVDALVRAIREGT